jgi:probable rRNA maturation factor
LRLRGTIEILLTGDARMRELNRRFRGVDSATDVLTFPGDRDGGEIAISLTTAARQAALRGIRTEEEVAYLAIHGMLHLAGMEDESDQGREAMQAEMARIGSKVPLPFEAAWTSLYRMEGAPA